MTSAKLSVNLKDNPEGYITDAVVDNTTIANAMGVEEIRLTMLNLPDIATITFNIEVLKNLTDRIIIIRTHSSTYTIPLGANQTVSDALWTFPAQHAFEKHFTLSYQQGDFQRVGEQVRIKYIGE